MLVSHLHGDHFGGLPFLILDAQFRRRTAPLTVAGPPGVRARVEAAMEVFFPGSTGVTRRFAVQFVELHEGVSAHVGGMTVTPFEVVQEIQRDGTLATLLQPVMLPDDIPAFDIWPGPSDYLGFNLAGRAG